MNLWKIGSFLFTFSSHLIESDSTADLNVANNKWLWCVETQQQDVVGFWTAIVRLSFTASVSGRLVVWCTESKNMQRWLKFVQYFSKTDDMDWKAQRRNKQDICKQQWSICSHVYEPVLSHFLSFYCESALCASILIDLINSALISYGVKSA